MMTPKDYGVKVLRAYENKRVGVVIFPSGVERDRLVKMGLVERLTGPVEDIVAVEDKKQPFYRNKALKTDG